MNARRFVSTVERRNSHETKDEDKGKGTRVQGNLRPRMWWAQMSREKRFFFETVGASVVLGRFYLESNEVLIGKKERKRNKNERQKEEEEKKESNVSAITLEFHPKKEVPRGQFQFIYEKNEVRRANGKPKQKNSQEKTEGVRLLMLETKDLVEEEEGRRDVE
ncbi:hypothetical protein RUM44_013840 [Polyplax serrata]|uniref:Uncharacterized protein n=1 Tax=Polyplax serrata TaxID=468196 RepID=A0ABR1BJE0_POLSC